jgi:glycosyltransferase involved in cell wall biosynthesis
MSLLQDKFSENKICVIVPTYNNAQTLPGVLESLLRYTTNVIVVNDGSTDSTATILAGFPQVRAIGYNQNQGKGFALKTGFSYAASLGFEYAITIDSDGQHYADDLIHFVEALSENPKAIIIGARNMDQAHIPGKSTFGNRFSSFWFWVNTGIRRNDTQSGYRLYPISAMQAIDFKTRKFEFEIEVLVRSAWNDIDVVEVPVKVFYPEKEKRISHFRPFRDFTRISILNTVLVTIAFLYIKPRDFFRRIKKKMPGKFSTSFFLFLAKPTR